MNRKMNRMNADEENVMFMEDMKWTASLQLAPEDWESNFSHILFFICVHPVHLPEELEVSSPAISASLRLRLNFFIRSRVRDAAITYL